MFHKKTCLTLGLMLGFVAGDIFADGDTEESCGIGMHIGDFVGVAPHVINDNRDQAPLYSMYETPFTVHIGHGLGLTFHGNIAHLAGMGISDFLYFYLNQDLEILSITKEVSISEDNWDRIKKVWEESEQGDIIAVACLESYQTETKQIKSAAPTRRDESPTPAKKRNVEYNTQKKSAKGFENLLGQSLADHLRLAVDSETGEYDLPDAEYDLDDEGTMYITRTSDGDNPTYHIRHIDAYMRGENLNLIEFKVDEAENLTAIKLIGESAEYQALHRIMLYRLARAKAYIHKNNIFKQMLNLSGLKNKNIDLATVFSRLDGKYGSLIGDGNPDLSKDETNKLIADPDVNLISYIQKDRPASSYNIQRYVQLLMKVLEKKEQNKVLGPLIKKKTPLVSSSKDRDNEGATLKAPQTYRQKNKWFQDHYGSKEEKKEVKIQKVSEDVKGLTPEDDGWWDIHYPRDEKKREDQAKQP